MKLAVSRKNLWEALPSTARSTLGAVFGRIHPSWMLGSRFRKQAAFLLAAQWWPRERSREFQVAALRRLCQVAERSPYYRRRFNASGFSWAALRQPEDISALECIDRDTVRDHLLEMCTQPTSGPRVDYVSTGGTGGQPLCFYIGAGRSAVEFAYLVAGWQRAGYELGQTLAVLRGRVVPSDRTGMKHEYDPVLRQHYYSSFDLSDDSVSRYLTHLKSVGPCFLHVYPSSIDAVARVVRRKGIAVPENVLGILAESEIVYPEQRQLAEATFGVRYFSSYGMTEKLVAAAECERSKDYHVWPTYGYFELLDSEGRPVNTPGVTGEIVATGFMNEVVPFIRYRTGDYATYVSDRCGSCGREHVVICGIRGHRTQEMLVASDGSAIAWTALNMHDDTFERVVRFQFLQERPGHAVLRIVPADGFSDTDAGKIARKLDRKLDGRIKISIERVAEIRYSASGKAIYVDQRIPSPWGPS